MNQKLYPKVPLIFYIFISIIVAAFTLDIFLLLDKLYVHRVRMDDSRLVLANIKPWIDGTFALSNLWNDHHPAPFSGMMYILSYELESLNFRLWKYFIGFAILLEVVAFSWLAWKSQLSSVWTKTILVLIISLVLMNGNASIRYEWNLLGISHFYYALAVPLLLALGMLAKGVNWKTITLFIFFAFINLIVFRSLALFWLVSILGVIFIRSLLLKFSDKKLLLAVFASILAALALEKGLFVLFDINLRANSISYINIIEAAKVWGSDPLNAISYIITALATGLINPGYLIKAGISTNIVQITWVCVGVVYLGAILVATFRIRNAQYIIPLIIMLFCALTIVAAMILRVQANHTDIFTSYWPRYIAMRDIGFIGVFWIAILEFERAQKMRFLLAYFVTPIVIACLVTLSFTYHYLNHDRAKYVRLADQKEQKAMVFMGRYLEKNNEATFAELTKVYREQHQTNMPAYFLNKILPIHDRHDNIELIGIYFLKQNSMNVFSETFDEGK
ncbi:MAG: hypothetical protein ACJAYF_001532 [Arenicella sp.]|jgi:hypothetical protein